MAVDFKKTKLGISGCLTSSYFHFCLRISPSGKYIHTCCENGLKTENCNLLHAIKMDVCACYV